MARSLLQVAGWKLASSHSMFLHQTERHFNSLCEHGGINP